MLHEPFVNDWDASGSPVVSQIERSCQSIVGVLHLIPSNLDVTLVMTTVLALRVAF